MNMKLHTLRFSTKKQMLELALKCTKKEACFELNKKGRTWSIVQGGWPSKKSEIRARCEVIWRDFKHATQRESKLEQWRKVIAM
jgi:hypothetical protein